MKRTSLGSQPCSIARTLDIAGEWWTPLIVRDVAYGLRRFGELQEDLGISANVLSDRLQSLVRAGLLPALRGGAAPGSDRWFLVDMHPGTHPFEELAAALLRVAGEPPADLVGRLRRGDLLPVIDEILPSGSELLLVVDQFEEVFTLVDEKDVRAGFLGLVETAATDPASRVRIVATLRADFYDRPLTYPVVAELMKGGTVTVTPLVPEEVERAVAGPAEAVGVGVDPALVADVVGQVTTQPGALPLLQYALTEIFERRRGAVLTMEASNEVGGLFPELRQALYTARIRAGRPDAFLPADALRLGTVGGARCVGRPAQHPAFPRFVLPMLVELDALPASTLRKFDLSQLGPSLPERSSSAAAHDQDVERLAS